MFDSNERFSKTKIKFILLFYDIAFIYQDKDMLLRWKLVGSTKFSYVLN